MNSPIRPYLLSAPVVVSGWTVASMNANSPYAQTHDGKVDTHHYTITGPKGSVYLLDLYAKPNCTPHGWEATKPNTTSIDGYYSTGGLTVEHGELTDYDGVFCLPRHVAATLRALGYKVDNDCLSSPL